MQRIEDTRWEVLRCDLWAVFACGSADGELCALTPEMMGKYEKLFYQPVVFVSAGGSIMEIPVVAKPDSDRKDEGPV